MILGHPREEVLINGNKYTYEELMPLSNEELYDGLVNGVLPDLALEVLCYHFKPLIMMMSWSFRKMLGIDEDEMLQEAKILLLKLVTKKGFKPNGRAHFVSYFYTAWKYRLLHIYRDYMLHNLMWIGERKQRISKGYSYEQLLAYNQRYIERYTQKRRIWEMRRLKREKGIALPERIEYPPDEVDDGSVADERIQSIRALRGARMIISVPLEEHSANSIRIMLGMIYNKQELLNKASEGNFYVSLELLDQLMYTTAKWNREVALQIVRHAGNDLLSGVTFGKNDLYFDGFPAFKDKEHFQAWRTFAIALNEASKEGKCIVIKKRIEENEKYWISGWIYRLHLAGPVFRSTRRILRENLVGSSGFRTPEVMRRVLGRFEAKPGFAEWKRIQVRKYREIHREEINARVRKRNQEKKQLAALSCSTDDDK